MKPGNKGSMVKNKKQKSNLIIISFSEVFMGKK